MNPARQPSWLALARLDEAEQFAVLTAPGKLPRRVDLGPVRAA